TVPLAFAQLVNIPPQQIYYVEEGHGNLPNNGAVESAVADLLSSGTTTALPNQRPVSRRPSRIVSEKRLKEMALLTAGAGQLGTADYRHLLDAVAAPPRAEQAIETSAVSTEAAVIERRPGAVSLNPQLQNLTIGHRRQRRLQLTLAHGSITDVDSQAYVLGVFRNVAPSGAAMAIDQRLDGAITEFTARRMFSGDVGTVFTVPVGRNPLSADMVLFAGLGSFDRFNADVQQLVAENVIRVLARSRIDDFATILIGAGSGQSVTAVLQNLLIGFFRGLKDADPRHRFRSITFCEADRVRFAEMKAEVYRLAAWSLFDEVDLDLDEIEVPPSESQPARALVVGPVGPVGPEPAYMIVRQESQTADRLHYSVSVLGSGMKAAVVTARQDFDQSKFASLLNKFDAAVGSNSNSPPYCGRPRCACRPYPLGDSHHRRLERRSRRRSEPPLPREQSAGRRVARGTASTPFAETPADCESVGRPVRRGKGRRSHFRTRESDISDRHNGVAAEGCRQSSGSCRAAQR
ncbi:MAG: hypothetical protein DMG17_30255, partial [Acidobacteria bacterium]